MNFGGRIKGLREAANISQEQLGRYLGIDQSTVAKIEMGDRHINTELIDKISNLFCIRAYDLLYAEDIYPKFKVAFRAKGIEESDFEAIASFNRVVLNCEFLEETEERRLNDKN